MACDIAIASENALFSQVETRAGVIPGFGGTWRMPQRVGTMCARYLIYTAAALNAHEAQAWGLVMKVVSADKLLERCGEIAVQIAASSPAAVAEAKRVLSANVQRGRAAGFRCAIRYRGDARAYGAHRRGTPDMVA